MIIDSASPQLQKLQAKEKHNSQMGSILINQIEDEQEDSIDNSKALIIMQKMNEKLAEYEQQIIEIFYKRFMPIIGNIFRFSNGSNFF